MSRIAEYLQYGLPRGSFVPPRPIRELRDLTRSRAHLQQDRNRVLNRMARLLDREHQAEFGGQQRRILASIVNGRTQPEYLAQRAVRTLKAKTTELEWLDGRLPSHAASWAGLCPGNQESAGKRFTGRTRKGDRYLWRLLVQNAWAVAHRKDCFLTTSFYRVARRRGPKTAAVAVAHRILVLAYHIIRDESVYQEMGGDYFDRLRPERTAERLTKAGADWLPGNAYQRVPPI